MFEKFTERARKSVTLARQEAQRLGSDSLGTEHLLLGIVAEGAGVAARVLHELHVDLKRLREQVEKRLPAPSAPSIAPVQIPFSPGFKRVIEFAGQAASQLGHDVIGTEHLLLGLMAQEEEIAALVLMELGLRIDTVQQKMLDVFAQANRTGAPEPPRRTALDEWDLRRWANEYRALTDRPSVQEPLAELLQQGRSIALVGHKRVGKTSILLAMSRAKAGTFAYWSVNYHMFDEFLARDIYPGRMPGTVCVITQAELLTASRCFNANLLEDRMNDGERLILEFREGGLESFAARYNLIAKDLVRVDVKPPDAAECGQLLESARAKLKAVANLDIPDDVIREADRLARDRWRLMVPPWSTIITLWTAETIHRQMSARGDVEQLERDLAEPPTPGWTPEEIELMKRHLDGLRSIWGTALSIESVRRAIGELSGQDSIPG